NVVTEESLRINHVRNLYQRATLAEMNVERIARLVGELGWRSEKRVGQRLRAERQELAEPLASTSSAQFPFMINHPCNRFLVIILASLPTVDRPWSPQAMSRSSTPAATASRSGRRGAR